MAKPLIYISYGMAKSGSTLAYRLAVECLRASGAPAPEPVLPGVTRPGGVTFVEVIRPAELAALRAQAEASGPLVVKTHGGMWDCVAQALDEGWAIGHAVARDPRGVALSMLDAARDGRGWGGRDGAAYRTAADTLPTIRANVEKFRKWAGHPAVLPLSYPLVAFDTATAAKRMATQIGVEVDARAIARAARRRGTNLNLGRLRRFETDLTAKENAAIADEFQGFIADFCDPDFTAPPIWRRIFAR